MTTESFLTRRYNITFLDARSIVTEAKLQLQITGYPSEKQQDLLTSYAMQIYERKYSSNEKCEMRERRNALDNIKSESQNSMGNSSEDRSCDASQMSSSKESAKSTSSNKGGRNPFRAARHMAPITTADIANYEY